MEFKSELSKLKQIIENEMDKSLPKDESLQSEIFNSMRYSVMAGGKRLRPILAYKACELVGGDINEVMPFALALEMIHTYSLIHDDLPAMDNDDYRRGKLTNHKVFGEAISILAGDGLLNLAYETIINHLNNNLDKSVSYLKAFNEIARASGVMGMIGGQVVDILSENKEIDEKTLNFIHKYKTSALIEASIVVGARVGGANQQQI